MTTQTKKNFSVLISLILVLGIIAPASAGSMSTAMNYVFLSNNYCATSVYYGLLSLYYDANDLDGTTFAYSALENMSSAAVYAYTAYTYATTGYNANPIAVNLNAKNTAYYDYYYKNAATNAIQNAISIGDAGSAIYYAYLALYWHGYAAYWTGLASNGGYQLERR